MNNFSLIKKIAKKFNITIIDVEKTPNYHKVVNMPQDTFVNKSYLCGNNDIVLGIYKNKEMRLASFFHEIGHTLVENTYMETIGYDTYLIESAAWYIGMKMASEYNVSFSKQTVKWITKNIFSYRSK